MTPSVAVGVSRRLRPGEVGADAVREAVRLERRKGVEEVLALVALDGSTAEGETD